MTLLYDTICEVNREPITMNAELEQLKDTSSTTAHNENMPASRMTGTEERPVFVSRFFRVDENGRKREFVRTQSGREIPIFDENDAATFEIDCPYDPDL